MSFLNVEIKARCQDPAAIRIYLQSVQAEFKGTDHQCDTYFNVKNGRLKLREGNIENNLIYYERENKPGPKHSDFSLLKVEEADKLKDMLRTSMGIKVIVKKIREIYYIRNVKFHIDSIEGLGSFVEIEAGNMLADLSPEELRAQCEDYMEKFNINETDLVDMSYSDMLMGSSISTQR